MNIVIVEIEDIKYKVDLSGFDNICDKSSSLLHSHANFELHIVLKNAASLDIEDSSIKLEQNDAVLLLPGVFHKFIKDENNSIILSFNFFVEKNKHKKSAIYYDILLNQLQSENKFIFLKQNNIISDFAKRIVTNINLDNPFSKVNIKALLTLIFSEIFLPFCSISTETINTSSSTSEFDSRIYTIENYFNDHYMDDIDLKKLSSLLCLSDMQTNRMIKKAFGMPFHECLFEIRMKSARKYLRETNMNVKDIAEKIGYQSYNGFYLAFKNKFGISPSDYRNQFKL